MATDRAAGSGPTVGQPFCYQAGLDSLFILAFAPTLVLPSITTNKQAVETTTLCALSATSHLTACVGPMICVWLSGTPFQSHLGIA